MRDARALIERGGPRPDAAKDSLTVALSSPGWPPESTANGIVPYVAAIAGGLRDLGHRAVVLSNTVLGDGPHEDVYELADPGRPNVLRKAWDRLHYLAAPASYGESRYARLMEVTARRLVAERGIDLLEVDEAFGIAARLARRLPVPIALRLHGPWFLNGVVNGVPEDAAFRRRVLREGRAIAAADLVTAPSLDVLERTREYYGLALPHAEVVFNPVSSTPPEARWRPEACEPGTVLFIGRFDRHKGADVALEAFGILASSRPDVRLLFAGPDRGLQRDDGRWSIDRFLREKLPPHAAARVTYLGQQSSAEVAQLRRRAAVTVVSSRYETFGYVAAEAQSFGCPVVATRVGGIPEIVEHNETGLLCRPEDPTDLAASIGRLLDDPGHAASLGSRAARQCGTQLDPTALAGRTAEIYRRAIARRARGERP